MADGDVAPQNDTKRTLTTILQAATDSVNAAISTVPSDEIGNSIRRRIADYSENSAKMLEDRGDALLEWATEIKDRYYQQAAVIREDGQQHAQAVFDFATKHSKISDIIHGAE